MERKTPLRLRQGYLGVEFLGFPADSEISWHQSAFQSPNPRSCLPDLLFGLVFPRGLVWMVDRYPIRTRRRVSEATWEKSGSAGGARSGCGLGVPNKNPISIYSSPVVSSYLCSVASRPRS